MYKNTYDLYNLFLVLCITIMLSCDTLAFAIVDIKGIKLSASGIIFPLDFLLLSIVTNAYGYKAAGRIIWYMLLCQFLFVLLVNSISILGHDVQNKTQDAYFTLYRNMWKLVFSSSIAILISYFMNDFLVSFCKIKIKLLEQQTIIRILISSAISQAVLVSISYSINFYGIYSFLEIYHIAVNTWLYKMICVLILVPFTSITVSLIKRIDKADAYDKDINYNPFLVFRK